MKTIVTESPLAKYLRYGFSEIYIADFLQSCIGADQLGRFANVFGTICMNALAFQTASKYFTFIVKDKEVTINVHAVGGDRDPMIGKIYCNRVTYPLGTSGALVDMLQIDHGCNVNM